MIPEYKETFFFLLPCSESPWQLRNGCQGLFLLWYNFDMARLANQRHELFCQGLAQGKSATQAYIDAGYSKNGADVSASRLLGNASVMLRVEELREKVEKKNELTLDWLIQQGKEMYQESREAKDRTAAASFYDKLCKIRGAYSPERHEHDVSVSGIDIDFIEPDDEN